MIFGICTIQKELVKKYCFGECGQILVGGLDGGDILGSLFSCNKKKCPYEEKRVKLGKLDNGEVVYLRKIKMK